MLLLSDHVSEWLAAIIVLPLAAAFATCLRCQLW
jgi:hypothetical protein